uniref:Sodium/potassium ATPase alpha subunit n=1 Tax=Macrostomum lignano TaxID=282301 RepID=A0A1I8FC88_9PLAT
LAQSFHVKHDAIAANLLSQPPSETWPKKSNHDAAAAAADAANAEAAAANADLDVDIDATNEEARPCRGAAFLRFLYNRNTGQILGRTGVSWAKIGAFYIVLLQLSGRLLCRHAVRVPVRCHCGGHTLQDGRKLAAADEPRPGLPAQPSMDSTLIEFVQGEPATYAGEMANLQQMYDTYKEMELKPDNVNVRKACEPDSKPDREPFKDCNPSTDFGYAVGKPCVVLKMNRVYGWLPDPLDPEVPHPMVTCFGENPADTENIGELEYFPSMETNYTGTPARMGYFSQAYFPYLKQ